MQDVDSPMKYAKKLYSFLSNDMDADQYRVVDFQLGPNSFQDHNNYFKFGPFANEPSEYCYLSIEKDYDSKYKYEPII